LEAYVSLADFTANMFLNDRLRLVQINIDKKELESMKKIATILVLLVVFSVSVFAGDGEYPAGGKNCPQGQTCFSTTGEIPIGNKSENQIYQDIFDFLKSLFE